MTHHSITRPALLALALALALLGSAAQAQQAEITLKPETGKVRVEIGGKLFTEYIYADTPKPYLYPVIGPGEVPMTRNYPMKKVEGEDTDHPHHRSLWFCHGSVNGVDFWADLEKSGKIVQDKLEEADVKDGRGIIRTTDNWVGPDGKLVLTDARTTTFVSLPGGARAIDFEITLKASEGDVTFGDTKEGSMAMRTNAGLRLVPAKPAAAPAAPAKKKADKTDKAGKKTAKGDAAGKGKKTDKAAKTTKTAKKKATEPVAAGPGQAINSEGLKGLEIWGKHARWVDYWGPIDGRTVGVAVFDHPANPRFPTTWHARDYGLIAVNPFGISDFEKKPKGTGDLKIEKGKEITFRYRFLFHDGNIGPEKVEEAWKAYTAK